MALPTKPGNTRRGWNDPPVLLHDTNLLSQQKKTAQNNRGPLENSAGGVVLLPPASTVEPRPLFIAPVIVPMLSNSSTNSAGDNNNTLLNESVDICLPNFESDEQLYHFVTTRLWRAISDCQTVMDDKESKDIAGKVRVLENMWQSGRISYPVKAAMARLVTALHRRLCDLAHDIHICLVMDYASEVGSWMIGVKRLINAARSVDAPLSPTDMSQPLSSVSVNENAAVEGTIDTSACCHHNLITNDKPADDKNGSNENLADAVAASAVTSGEDLHLIDHSANTPHATPDEPSDQPISTSNFDNLTLSQVADKLHSLDAAALSAFVAGEELHLIDHSSETPHATPDEPLDQSLSSDNYDNLTLSQVADKLNSLATLNATEENSSIVTGILPEAGIGDGDIMVQQSSDNIDLLCQSSNVQAPS